MYWRTELRLALLAALLQLSLPAAAGAAATPNEPPVAGAAGADREGCNEPLCYTASSLEAERNRMVLHDINIVDTTRGITRIRADLAEANGQDLGNSEWVLTGHVQVFMPQGKLSADKATVQFVNKRIASMSAQGAPAEFEHGVDTAGQDRRFGRRRASRPRPDRERTRACARNRLRHGTRPAEAEWRQLAVRRLQ